MNGLDIFSGGGWFTEGMAPWFKPVAYCENDAFAQRVLLSRIYRREIPTAPIWDDVRTLRAGMLPAQIHCIYGGFPCQGHSLAGARKRMADSRSQLFWEIVRLAEETKTPFVFLENVWPGIRRSIPTIRAALESLGYSCRDGHLAASDVGLPHRRERWFMLAYSDQNRRRLQPRGRSRENGKDKILACANVETRVNADADGKGQLQQKGVVQNERGWSGDVVEEARFNPHTNQERRKTGWLQSGPESELPALTSALERDDWNAIAAVFCGMDHGKPYRGHRIGVLGNSVPWIQYQEAFKRLMGL